MNHTFAVGINYWPIKKAMYWWKFFDPMEVAEDFSLLNRYGLQVVRLFLTWEDFQPRPDQVNRPALKNLIKTADLAAENNLCLMPTFFCGHMSGVNWIPDWALENKRHRDRFPVYSDGRLTDRIIRNFYLDPAIREAQKYQVREVCQALRDHPAIGAYDLGNESSNCCIPPERTQGRAWLREMHSLIRFCHPQSFITLGMHTEDLEEDRHLWPQDAALYCDFLSMHGYPFYLSWATPEDVYVLPFLGIITAWLGGKPVLFQEFGAPSQPCEALRQSDIAAPAKTPLWSEEQVSLYYQQALNLLRQSGMTGALAWCYADYHPFLYQLAPLQENPHERHFGLVRYDGSVKPALGAMSAAAENPVQSLARLSWLPDEEKDAYYEDPQRNLAQLFTRFKTEWSKGGRL